jgi:hypothetical protein
MATYPCAGISAKLFRSAAPTLLLIELGFEIFPHTQQTPVALGRYAEADAEKWWLIHQGVQHHSAVNAIVWLGLVSGYEGQAAARPMPSNRLVLTHSGPRRADGTRNDGNPSTDTTHMASR